MLSVRRRRRTVWFVSCLLHLALLGCLANRHAQSRRIGTGGQDSFQLEVLLLSSVGDSNPAGEPASSDVSIHTFGSQTSPRDLTAGSEETPIAAKSRDVRVASLEVPVRPVDSPDGNSVAPETPPDPVAPTSRSSNLPESSAPEPIPPSTRRETSPRSIPRELAPEVDPSLPDPQRTVDAPRNAGPRTANPQRRGSHTRNSSRGAGSPGGETRFFGRIETGRRIVYLVDCSDSMWDRFDAVQAELRASINALSGPLQVTVVFYNDDVLLFGAAAGDPPTNSSPSLWVDNTPAGRRRLIQFIQSVVPTGGTDHSLALRTALGLKPDLLFMLSDASDPALSANELRQIRALNRGSASIHTFDFQSDVQGGTSFLELLAHQNRGQDTVVSPRRHRSRARE